MSGAGLKIISNKRKNERVEINQMLTIGRSSGNNLILNDEIVSRYHAIIQSEMADYYIIDLGSANGTFLNGQPINSAMKLQQGDEIRFGESVMQFLQSDSLNSEEQGELVNDKTVRVFEPVNICLLVTDVRRYTSMSEQIPNKAISQFIAGWFDIAGRCVENHHGMIEHFRGDSLAAYWLADDNNKYIENAIATAIHINKLVLDISSEFSAKFTNQKFQIGCAVHIGNAIMCNIGTDSRRDLTMLGDTINVAYRIEALCKNLERKILLSHEVRQHIRDEKNLENLGLQKIKGKSEMLRIYALH